MTDGLKPVELTVVDSLSEDWQDFPVPAINANLEHVPLFSDEETGMMAVKMVYRAGFTNSWHTHPCGHGMYVLKGTLKTHQGGELRVVPRGRDHGARRHG